MQMQALRDVLSRFDYIDFALLFGSTVDDTQKVLSDMAVAIYTKRPIDLVLPYDLYKHHVKLAFNIVDKHKVILNNNREKLHFGFKFGT